MEFHDLTYWQNKAARLTIEGRLFYQGDYRAAASGDTFSVLNPATGEPLAEVRAGRSATWTPRWRAPVRCLSTATGRRRLPLRAKRCSCAWPR